MIDARFEPAHPPVQVLPARLEVMGRVSATVRTPSGLFTIAGPGKWHEQTRESPALRDTLHLSHRDEPRSRDARRRASAGAVWFCVDGR